MGGTAVGTGINSHPDFAVAIAAEISRLTGEHFETSPNKFHALTSKDEMVQCTWIIESLKAADLMKIANDVRWLPADRDAALVKLRYRPMNQEVQ